MLDSPARCFPFSQKSAIFGDTRTHMEPGSAWMGMTAPPVSARWVLDVPRDEDPQGYSLLLGACQLCSGLMVGTG